jgi:Tfp pilus assembly protein FimV
VAKAKSTASEFDEIVRRTAEEERRLLKRERRSEKRVAELRDEVAEAEARLAQAQERLDRRNAALAAAQGELAGHRAARARGPSSDLHASALPDIAGSLGTLPPASTTPTPDPATSD